MAYDSRNRVWGGIGTGRGVACAEDAGRTSSGPFLDGDHPGDNGKWSILDLDWIRLRPERSAASGFKK